MTRIKRGVEAHRRHRKIVKAAKGYRGQRSTTFRQAKNAVMKAGTNAYRDRRLKKRTFRRLWTTKIGALTAELGISYSKLIDALKKNKIEIDRKILADIAENEPKVFEKIVEEVK